MSHFDLVPRTRSLLVRPRLLGLICAMTSVLLFSTFTLVSRLGLTSTLRLVDIVALRFGVGGALLLPVFLKHRLHGVKGRDALVLAFFGGFGFATLAYGGFYLSPAAHGSVFLHGALTPFTSAILVATGQRPAHRVTGIALIVGGTVFMALDSWTGSNLRQLCGDGLLLLASAFWAAYGIRSRTLGLPPAQSASIVAVLSMCVVLPLYATDLGKGLVVASLRDLLLQVLVQGVLVGAVSIFVYTYAVASLGAAETSLFTAAVPCLTTLAAIPLLDEAPGPLAIAGVGIVTLGMLVAPRRDNRHRNDDTPQTGAHTPRPSRKVHGKVAASANAGCVAGIRAHHPPPPWVCSLDTGVPRLPVTSNAPRAQRGRPLLHGAAISIWSCLVAAKALVCRLKPPRMER